MKTKKGIYDLHEENKTWLSSLAFYKDEFMVMQRRIEEIAKKNTAKDVLQSIEHFQNQLIVQKEQLDILAHDIREKEYALETAANKNPTAIDHQHFPDELVLADRIKTFEKLFSDLRGELTQFLVKWM
jgi:cobalamin biosynthesis protein CbiD